VYANLQQPYGSHRGVNIYPNAAVSVNGEARLAKLKGLNLLVAVAFLLT
jgi:hypothetical protein